MGYINGENSKQHLLFPSCLDECIEDESPVRLFDAFVNKLDFKNFGFERETPKAEGRPGYNPRDLMKLYIYSYYYRLRSSRQIARECKVNIEIMWLIGKLTPDFRTIANFRKNNQKAIRKVFKEFNRFCYQMELFSHEGVSIDGSKFKAVNAKDKNFTQSKLDDRLERIDNHIKEYLLALDVKDIDEKEAVELEKKLKEYKERKNKYEEILSKMTNENLSQVSLTDPEAKLMKMSEGFGVCYNTQTAVDIGSHLIVDFEVTNDVTDHGQITNLAKKIKENFREFEEQKNVENSNKFESREEQVLESIADKGYQDTEDMAEALANGIIPNVIPNKGTTVKIEYDYVPTEITNEIKQSNKPEDLRKCLQAGVVPDVYKDILTIEGIENRVQYEYESTDAGIIKMDAEQMLNKAREGYFVRNAELNLVICPQGKILRQKSIKKNGYIRYYNKLACKSCTNKCTKSKWKEVDFSKDSLIHKVGNNQKTDNKKECVKDESIKRTKHVYKKTIYNMKLNMEKLAKRMSTSEHPFGTIKHHLCGYYFLLKGKAKVEAETALLFLAYNMRRAINMLTVSKMLDALR